VNRKALHMQGFFCTLWRIAAFENFDLTGLKITTVIKQKQSQSVYTKYFKDGFEFFV